MIVRRMSRELSSDWFDFFDNRAFADHGDWKGCYCTFYHMPRDEAYEGSGRRRRDYAAWLVETGRMQGYLAYEDERCVGWCNVNMRSEYRRLGDLEGDAEGVRSITCFLVQKEFRGEGIARKLLERVVVDAGKEGIRILEAYPRKKSRSEYGNYHGPFRMYLKSGFVEERIGDVDVVRKYLRRP